MGLVRRTTSGQRGGRTKALPEGQGFGLRLREFGRRVILGLPVLRLILLALTLCSAPLFAENNAKRRGEARAEVQKLLSGGNPQAGLSRITYLGEARYASGALMRSWPELADEALRRNVAFVLAGLHDPSTEAFLARLVDAPDSAVRMSAAQGLGRLKSRRVEALVPLLADGSLGVRREAAKALGLCRQKRMGKILIKAAKGEGEPEVRAAMLLAAGQCGDVKVASDLATFLTSSSESARVAAAQGLCALGDERGFAFAKKLLGSEDKYERRMGLGLFEGLPARKTRVYLEPLLRDPDKHVSAGAARVLYEGGDASKLDWLVLASHLSKPADKLIIEAQLERLMLTDERRKQILKEAGVE